MFHCVGHVTLRMTLVKPKQIVRSVNASPQTTIRDDRRLRTHYDLVCIQLFHFEIENIKNPKYSAKIANIAKGQKMPSFVNFGLEILVLEVPNCPQ